VAGRGCRGRWAQTRLCAKLENNVLVYGIIHLARASNMWRLLRETLHGWASQPWHRRRGRRLFLNLVVVKKNRLQELRADGCCLGKAAWFPRSDIRHIRPAKNITIIRRRADNQRLRAVRISRSSDRATCSGDSSCDMNDVERTSLNGPITGELSLCPCYRRGSYGRPLRMTTDN
jgi:hypothetical protein